MFSCPATAATTAAIYIATRENEQTYVYAYLELLYGKQKCSQCEFEHEILTGLLRAGEHGNSQSISTPARLYFAIHISICISTVNITNPVHIVSTIVTWSP